MAKTFTKAFDEVKARFEEADISEVKSDFAIQVNMINKDCGGAFYIQVKDSELFVEPYDYKHNDAMISAMQGDILKLINGKLNPVAAFATGKVVVKGNLDKVMELANIKVKPEPVKKPATSKKAATPKKTVTKAEVKPAAKDAAKKAKTQTIVKSTSSVKKITSKNN